MKRFNQWDLEFKRVMLKVHGRYLMSTGFFQYTVKLYSLGKFFIEQYYDRELEEITRVTLACRKDLDKYMIDISLSDLGVLTVL